MRSVNDLDHWETSEEILEAANVTTRQLERWCYEGLFERRQRSLGRGRGTETIYPLGTKRRVLRLCEILKRNIPLRDARWFLWWEGHDINMELVRDYIREVTDEFRSQAKTALKLYPKLFESNKLRFRSKFVRGVYRRIENKVLVMNALFRVLTGQFDSVNEDLELHAWDVEEGLGFNPGGKPANERIATPESLSNLFSAISDKSSQSNLSEFTDDDLIKVRNDLVFVLGFMSGLSELNDQKVIRPFRPWLKNIGDQIDKMKANDLAAIMSLWILMTGDAKIRKQMQDGIDSLKLHREALETFLARMRGPSLNK